jgi:ABC-type nitrate/sulfonate/bicarbonate transport system substrate-binding protein
MKIRTRTAIIGVAFAVAALSGCGAADQGTTEETTGAATALRLSLVPAMTTFAAAAADVKGFYEEQGLDATVIPLANLSNAIPGLSNQYDIVYGTPTDVVLATEKGFDIVIIAGNHFETEDAQQVQLIAGKDSGVDSVSDLAGKRIALPSLSGTIYASTLATLDKAGIAPDDVTFVEVPFPNMIDQLNAGQVDAIYSVQPFLNVAIVQGHLPLANPLLSVSDPALSGVWIAMREWAEQNPETVDAFRASLADSVAWIAQNDAEARALLSEELGLSEKIVADLKFPEWTTDVVPDDLVPWIGTLKSTGQLEGDGPSPESIIFAAG